MTRVVQDPKDDAKTRHEGQGQSMDFPETGRRRCPHPSRPPFLFTNHDSQWSWGESLDHSERNGWMSDRPNGPSDTALGFREEGVARERDKSLCHSPQRKRYSPTFSTRHDTRAPPPRNSISFLYLPERGASGVPALGELGQATKDS